MKKQRKTMHIVQIDRILPWNSLVTKKEEKTLFEKGNNFIYC